MYTTVIGRKFLDAYNKRENTNLSAKEFFETEFIPIFYDHPKYFMTGGNSPLENPKISWKQGNFPDREERKERISKLIKKIESSSADASIAIGFPSLDLAATTSSQITNMKSNFDINDIYFSWIGSGLGLGIKGGLILLFENDKILLQTFDGWKYYRSFLNDNAYSKLRGNQITTWNGQWISHRYSDDYFPENPIMDFSEKAFQTLKSGIIELHTEHWVMLLIVAISKMLGSKDTISYVYNLSQTNTTIGFIPINFSLVNQPIHLYKKLFGENNYLKDSKKIINLYGTAFGYAAACQRGQIGVQALEPKGLRTFMTSQNKSHKLPNYKNASEEILINYNTYITWVIAMLDNEKLWQLSGEVAENLILFVKTDDKKLSTKRSNLVKTVLEVKTKRQFLESLIPIVKEVENKKSYVELGEEMNKMVTDNFPYFHTLIRFRYAEKNN